MQFDANVVIGPAPGNPKETPPRSGKQGTERTRDRQPDQGFPYLRRRPVESRDQLDAHAVVVRNDTSHERAQQEKEERWRHNIGRIVGEQDNVFALLVEFAERL